MRVTLFRIKILGFLFFLFAVILTTQLYLVQIVKGAEYTAKANNQYVRTQNMFERGSIFFEDKNGKRIPAGTIKTGFLLTINPTVLKETEVVYKKLSEIIPLDESDFFKRASYTDDTYEVIASRVDADTAQKITELNINGVWLEREQWRFYPGNELASNTLGFVGYNGNSLEGIYGLENYYEYVLRRQKKSLFVNFFAEAFSNLSQVVSGEETEKEGDIILTIEPSVQFYLETTLKEVSENWSANLVGGIIIDPFTGEIYGMGVFPNFDLNNFSSLTDVNFGNPLVENVYEMGSIMKALTMAIGLDTGAVTAETTYNDTGFLILDGQTISNYDHKARGIIKMQAILNQSLNVGAAFVESQIGHSTFAKYLLDLGLGEETGIDLLNETYGLVANLERKTARDIEFATASYGQGVAVTPIGAVKALSALANGGMLIVPHLVKEIKYSPLSSNKIFYEKGKRIFKEETSAEISRMLIEVVDEALLGGTVKSENYSIAAKTGTAQMVSENGRGYAEDKYLHSFFGYFPATKPRFLVFLYLIDPKEVDYASQTLTTPFLDIFKFLVNYYEILPDRGMLVDGE